MPAKTTETLTTRQVAEALGTDPKTLRVFLRASDDYQAVGAGSRYAFTTKDVGPMKTRFAKWLRDRAATKAAKAEALKKQTTPSPKRPVVKSPATPVDDDEMENDEHEDELADAVPAE